MLPTLLTGSAVAALGHPMVVLLLKVTIILLVALGITMAMQRRSAGARHLVWLVALAMLLVVPAVAVWAPLRLEVLPAAGVGARQPALAEEPAAGPRRATIGEQPAAGARPAALGNEPTAEPSSAGLASAGQSSAESARPAWIDGLTIAVALWAAVVLLIGASLAWSAFVVRRIVRHAVPLADESWTTPLFEVADRLELDEVPRLLRSEQAKMPFACGLLAPTIVFPAECDGWSLDRRRAVLLHELAHVRRHDLLGHTLGRLACALWWFHPLVWTAAKQLRAESERACDDLALSCGTRATDYAEHLLDIVTSVRRDATPSVALAMARRKEFEGRMLAILDPELRRATPGRLQTAGLVASLGMIALVVGAAAPAPRRAAPQQQQQAARDSLRHDSVTWTAGKPSDRKIQREVDRAMERTAGTVGRTVDTSVGTIVPSVVQTVVPAVVESVVGGLLGRTGTRTAARTRTETRTEVRDAQGNVIASAAAGAAASAAASARAALSPESLRDYIEQGQEQDRRSQGKDDRPVLLAKILRTEGDPELRRIAAWGLAEYAEQQVAVEALSDALRSDKDASVREMAAWSLGEGGGDRGPGTDALAQAVRSDASDKVRETAVWALGERGDRSSLPALVETLGSGKPEVRRLAIWAIGEIGPKQAPPALLAMLKDSDPEIREITAWALYEIEDPAAAPALQAALAAEQNTDLQISYIRALATIGEKSVDAIRGLLESKDQRVRSMAVRALAGGDATGPWPMPMPRPRPSP